MSCHSTHHLYYWPTKRAVSCLVSYFLKLFAIADCTGCLHDKLIAPPEQSARGLDIASPNSVQAFSLLVISPVIIALTGLGTYVAVIYSSTINDLCRWSYMSSITVSAANILGSLLAKKSVEVEGWRPKHIVQVSSSRIWASSIEAIVLYQFCLLSRVQQFLPIPTFGWEHQG